MVPCKGRSPKTTKPNAYSRKCRRTGWIGFTTCNLRYGKSIAKCIREEFEKALARKKDQCIQFPVMIEEIQNSIDEFEEKYGMYLKL